jgi:hypothetical protein
LRKPSKGNHFAALTQIISVLKQAGELLALAVQHLAEATALLGDLELVGGRAP